MINNDDKTSPNDYVSYITKTYDLDIRNVQQLIHFIIHVKYIFYCDLFYDIVFHDKYISSTVIILILFSSVIQFVDILSIFIYRKTKL